MFREYKEELHTDIFKEKDVTEAVEGDAIDEIVEEQKGETTVNEIGGFEKMESFPLKPEMQLLIKEFFAKKDFEVIEMTNAYVKVKSPGGRMMTIENKVAAEYIGKNI